MFKITGKQRFGAAHRDGRCIVNFRNGVGYASNASDAQYLKKRGYTVEENAPAAASDPLAGLANKQLLAYAQDRGIDLTGVANNRGKILAAIRAVEPLPVQDEDHSRK